MNYELLCKGKINCINKKLPFDSNYQKEVFKIVNYPDGIMLKRYSNLSSFLII
jgi:hypothetical protein